MKFKSITKFTFAALIVGGLQVSAIAHYGSHTANPNAPKKETKKREAQPAKSTQPAKQIKLTGSIITVAPAATKKADPNVLITRPITLDFTAGTYEVGQANDVRKSGISNDEKNHIFKGALLFKGDATRGYSNIVLKENGNGDFVLKVRKITPGNIKNGIILVSQNKEGSAVAKKYVALLRKENTDTAAYNNGRFSTTGKVMETPLYIKITPNK